MLGLDACVPVPKLSLFIKVTEYGLKIFYCTALPRQGRILWLVSDICMILVLFSQHYFVKSSLIQVMCELVVSLIAKTAAAGISE